MNEAPTTAALPNHPDPSPDRDAAPESTRTGVVLSLLYKLIGYGRQLADSLKQGAPAQFVLTVAMHFGTRDIALILRRIARGIQLATALETRLAGPSAVARDRGCRRRVPGRPRQNNQRLQGPGKLLAQRSVRGGAYSRAAAMAAARRRGMRNRTALNKP